MIVPRQGFKKRYQYGGSGIFEPMTRLLMKIFSSGAAKQLASSALDAGTKEGAKKALEVGATAAADAGKKLVQKALTPKSKTILKKYSSPQQQQQPQNINSLIDGSAVDIQNLVKKLNSGMGIKTISR